MSITIDMKDYPRWLKEKAGARMRVATKACLDSGPEIIKVLQISTKNAPPASPSGSTGAYAFGNYYSGWRVVGTLEGVKITNTENYSRWVEEGRNPGKLPNIDNIVRWVQKRLGVSPDIAKRLAFPIAKQIAANGLQPRNVLGSQKNQITEIIEKNIAKAIDDEWSRK